MFSAAHDADEEFIRRYGEPSRAQFMLSFHGQEPSAADAIARLKSLL